jgi:dihydrodipicolinate synthase/N-acetylneuraminate lyase
LDRDERRAVVETVARVTNGRGTLIVGVSAPNWRIAGDHAGTRPTSARTP